MQKVHKDLFQVFINPLGFTSNKILNLIISQHCCEVGFWSNVERNDPQTYQNVYRAVLFASHLGNVVPFFFKDVLSVFHKH